MLPIKRAIERKRMLWYMLADRERALMMHEVLGYMMRQTAIPNVRLDPRSRLAPIGERGTSCCKLRDFLTPGYKPYDGCAR